LETLASFAIGDASRVGALAAAKWIPGFYPHVATAIVDDTVELRSSRYDHEQLTTIWATALANEQAHNRAQAPRAAAFAALAE
jgi:hypothetical protein